MIRYQDSISIRYRYDILKILQYQYRYF